MSKNRHIKTPDEKYGKYSLRDITIEFLKFYRDMDEKWCFDNLPYLGIFYFPENCNVYVNGSMIYEKCDIYNEHGGLIKCKVIEINNHHMVFAHFDDHHYQICFPEIRKDDVFIVGNILKSIIIRRIFPELVAHDVVDVKPLTGPRW